MPRGSIRILPLRCGEIRVSPLMAFGGPRDLRLSARLISEKDEQRVTLPCAAFLIEHPKARILLDTGWPRSVSPRGEYDPSAAGKLLPSALVSLYQPWVPRGQTAAEQLSALGLCPSDLDFLLLSHLDADHTAALGELQGAKSVLCSQEEMWWSYRTVYRLRQPQSLWRPFEPSYFWYKGSPEGPARWSYDLLGDGSVELVCLPGHTDGMFGLRLSAGGRFVFLCADAAYSPRNWRELLVPGFGFNPTAQEKSLRYLASLEQDSGCAGIFCSHDPTLPFGSVIEI